MGMRVLYYLNATDLGKVPEEARWAESMGYDGLCSQESAHDPFFPLLLAATATSRVTLESRVAIAFPRSPMVVAYAAMDLQEFSGGRFRLGLGTQVKGHNERRFSVKWESPGPKLREYVQSLHAIWDNWQEGKKLDFQGRFYTFTLMTPFFSPGAGAHPRPPVYVSAINPYNCRVAGEVCDGLAVHPLTSPEYLKEVIMPNVAKGAAQAGRARNAIKISGAGFIITGPDSKAIAARKKAVKRQIAFYASTRTYSPVLETHGFQDVGRKLHEMSLAGQWEQMPSLISDELLNAFAVVGSYDEVAAQVKERYGDLLDEVVFNMEASSPGDQRALQRIIEGLKA
jgi:probable F420-dependent oxidoreductase